MQTSSHIPVLLQQVLHILAPQSGHTYFDGTLGGGGHAHAILTAMHGSGTYIATDKDERVLAQTVATLSHAFPGVNLIGEARGFEDVTAICGERKVSALDGALLDLGWGSHTLTGQRGFSFLTDEPLVMTYETPRADTVTAGDIINTWDEETLVTLFRIWGEEPRARKAAAAIVAHRAHTSIKTTGDLVRVLEGVLPRIGKTHPATRIFQALRIAVNKEIEILEPACTHLRTLLAPGAPLLVITFHSGEDRVIKHLFNQWHDEGLGTHLTKKVIVASREEQLENPRARSAKLRVFQKKKSM